MTTSSVRDHRSIAWLCVTVLFVFVSLYAWSSIDDVDPLCCCCVSMLMLVLVVGLVFVVLFVMLALVVGIGDCIVRIAAL